MTETNDPIRTAAGSGDAASPNPNFGAARGQLTGAGRAYQSDVAVKSGVPQSPENAAALDVATWAVSGDFYFGCPQATPELKPGFYRCGESMRGPYLERMTVRLDAILRLPDPVADILMAEFVKFWAAGERMRAMGLGFKRGVILWGPPGSGKTSLVQLMAHEMVVAMQGVVLMAAHPQLTIQCLHILRRIEPHRPIIVVYEDFDALVDRFGEAEWLSLLDGENQVSNVVNIATTNYPERLDPRFVDRPGRFDRVAYMGMPSAEARAEYLRIKAAHVDEATRKDWVAATDGWSLAHLRELIVATQALEEEASAVIKRLAKMQEDLATSERPPERNLAGLDVVKGTRQNGGIGFQRGR